MQTETVTGITHDIHVRTEDDEIQDFEGVLDVMKLPSGNLKFTHNGELQQFSNGEIVRSRVNNVDTAHKYVCPECGSDESALITASDYGEMLKVECGDCGANGLERHDL